MKKIPNSTKQPKTTIIKNLSQKIVALSATITSVIFNFTPPSLAEIESSPVFVPRYCRIYSSLINSYFSCEKYLITYDRENGTTAHHFIIKQYRGKIDEIMLFSPRSISAAQLETQSFDFYVNQMLIIVQTQGKKPLHLKGYGRCFVAPSGISCSFEDDGLRESLTIKIDF